MKDSSDKKLSDKEDSDYAGNALPNLTQELKSLMIGFGENDNPDSSTVSLLEEFVIEYIQNISILAYKRSKRKNCNEIQLKDLLYIIKNDKKKFYRIPLLLSFYENIKKTKK